MLKATGAVCSTLQQATARAKAGAAEQAEAVEQLSKQREASATQLRMTRVAMLPARG